MMQIGTLSRHLSFQLLGINPCIRMSTIFAAIS